MKVKSLIGLLMLLSIGAGAQMPAKQDSVPEAMVYWMNGLKKPGVRPMHIASQKSVQPLLTSLWNQEYPYKDYTPVMKSGHHAATGCVATAMSQVLYYWKYPERPKPVVITYNWIRGAGDTVVLHHDFGQSKYDWKQMHDEVLMTAADSNGRKSVGQLMRDCGYAVKSKYGPSTSANSSLPARVLKEIFGYSNSINIIPRAYVSDAEWDAIIKKELDAGRPVLFSGETATDCGHCFVCDGYNQDGYFHFNWGWGGLSNGYFPLKSLDPQSQGAGGSGADSTGYNWGQSIIIGIRPPKEGTQPARPLVSADKCTFTKETFGYSASFSKLYNRGCTKLTNAYVGLVLQDMQGQTIKALDSIPFTLAAGSFMAATKTLDTHKLVLQFGNTPYRIVLAYRMPNGWADKKWYTVYGLHGKVYSMDVLLRKQS